MTNDTKNLMDQINSEWDLIIKPFREAEKQYQLDLKNLILKHVSSPMNFRKDYEKSWRSTYEDRSNISACDFIYEKDVLETMLNEHLCGFEYSDE